MEGMGGSTATAPAHETRTGDRGWPVLLALYAVTALVETLGVSQVFAFLPIRLREVGLAEGEIPRFVGLFSALIFVFGLPLVPFWGVWADLHSRKVVIIRSAVVESVVFAGVAASAEPWQLAASLLLVGLQLGNTGVMLAAIRDAVPRARLGLAVAVFGAASPVGFAVGPILGGVLIDGLGLSLSAVFWVSAGLSAAVVLLLGAGSREVRPSVVPEGRVLALAGRAVRGALAEPVTRRLFVIFGVALLGNQMSRPFVPLLVERANGGADGLASAIGLVVGTAALAGAVVSPVSGALGDRVGFRVVLAAALVGCGTALVLMPLAPGVPSLAVVAMAFAALNAAVMAMVFGLLAVEVPPDRRSATLNLVLLPLYLAGIVGPAIGAAVAGAGVPAVFVVAGAIVGLGGLVVAWSVRRARGREAAPIQVEPGDTRA